MVPPGHWSQSEKWKNLVLRYPYFWDRKQLYLSLFQEKKSRDDLLIFFFFSKEPYFFVKNIVPSKQAERFQRHNTMIVMDKGNCSETDNKGTNNLTGSEIYFPWGHGARRCVSMAPAFVSVVLILAKNILKVDSHRYLSWCIHTFYGGCILHW